MKRLLCIVSALLVFALHVVPSAHAETDPFDAFIEEMLNNGMTLTDIAIICENDADVINDFKANGSNTLALICLLCERELARRGWQSKEVTVPAGTYTIGIDIPAGVYTITAVDLGFLTISTRSAKGESLEAFILYSVYGDERMDQVGKLELKEGETITITGTVTFTTYKGLGF